MPRQRGKANERCVAPSLQPLCGCGMRSPHPRALRARSLPGYGFVAQGGFAGIVGILLLIQFDHIFFDRVVGFALYAMVVAQVVRMSVTVVFAVCLVVLVRITDNVHERKAIVRRDEIDARGR